jgi:acyl carrier protein
MDTDSDGLPPHEPAGKTRTAEQVTDWLVVRLARLLNCPPAEIDVTASCARLGLDSATVVALTFDLEDWLGVTIEPGIFFDYPTLRQLGDQLARRVG